MKPENGIVFIGSHLQLEEEERVLKGAQGLQDCYNDGLGNRGGWKQKMSHLECRNCW